MQHLDGDVAVVLEIVREVDGGHAAGADLAVDTVAIREGVRQSCGGGGHPLDCIGGV